MDQIFAQIMEYARGTWRYRWVALAVAWLVACVGWAYVYTLPDQYQASARVYLDTQSLLRPLMSDLTVRPRVEQQVDLMTRTLLSRPNMAEVARRTDLDLRADSDREMEALLAGLQQDISLDGSPRSNLYSISYQSANPDLARRVVQALLNIFVESGLGNTRADINASQEFINRQIAAYEDKLEALEQRIEEFKREHYGMLPGQDGDYFNQLKQANAQLQAARLALDEAQRRADIYSGRLEGTEPVLLPTPSTGAGPSPSLTPQLDARISAMRQHLDQLRLRYTNEHPEVIATRRMIASLEAERDQKVAELQAAATSTPGFDGLTANAYVQQMRLSLVQAESQVASLTARAQEYEQRYQALKAAINRIPAVEAQFKALTRDYQVLQSNYQSLLASRETALLSSNLETQTDSVQFRIVEPPFVPAEPVGPPRLLLSAGVLVVALGAGVGLAFLISQLRPAVMSRTTLERIAQQRPFLGAISMSETPRATYRRRLGLATYAATTATLFVAFGGLASVYLIG